MSSEAPPPTGEFEAGHAPGRAARRGLMALGLLAFFHLGALQAAYGPAFAALQARHGIDVNQVGTSVGAQFFGGFVGVLVSGVLLARLGYRRSMIAAALLLAAGSGVVAGAPSWPMVISGAVLGGIGYGVSVVLYNFLFARAFAPGGTAAVNLINGMFGVGAIAMPGFVGLVTAALVAGDLDRIAQVPPLVFGGAATVALLVALLALRIPWLPPRRRVKSGSSRPATANAGVLGIAALFSALLFLYVASEVSTTSWAPTHLAERVGVARAALVVSVFWVAMTVGRFLAAAFAARWRPGDVVLVAVALALGGIVVAHLPGLAFVGYAIVGLGLAPVFPTAVVWIERRFGERTERVAPWILAIGNLGPVLGTPAVGVAVAVLGPAAVPSALAGALVLLAAVVLALWWGDARDRGSPRQPSPAPRGETAAG